MPDAREHFRLTEIAPGLHVALATVDGFGLCNSAIVDLGGATLVFDAMLTPQAGTALGAAARRITGQDVDLLVDSHHHGDHVRGNGAVGARHIVGTRRTRDLIVEQSAATLESDRAEARAELDAMRSGRSTVPEGDRPVLTGWFEGISATPVGWRTEPPNLLLAEELVVAGRRREVRILTFGGGHSPSDVFVLLPDDGVVLLGDLLAVGFHPSLGDGDPPTLVRILERILGLRFERALPGHGPVGGRSDVQRMIDYVRWLESIARAGEPPGPTSAFPEPFRSWKFALFVEPNLARVAATLPRAGTG